MTILIFVGALLAAMAIGVPISYALLASGAALMWHLDMFDAQILAQNLLEGANSFPLLAVPFFMLAGEIMNAGGLSRRIVNFAMTLVGHVKGGLGYVGIMAAVIMAALSGSAVADAAALAALLLPMMVAAGHDKARSAGLLSAASIIAPVIPPSIGFVIFGVAANVSISKLFLAGIVPGVLLGVSLCFTWWWLGRRENVPPQPRRNKAEIFQALKDALFALGLPVIVVGTAMDMTPTILILTPVLMPIVKAAGIDPVYFGVLFIMNNAIGLITPPVGTVLNTVAGVGKISMDEVTKGVWPFMIAQFGLMFLMVAFPAIVIVPARWLAG